MILVPIHLDAPICTVEKFAELTGLTKRTVENYMRAGRIPIIPKQGKAETVLINMVLYTQMAMNQPAAAPATKPVRTPKVSRKRGE